MTALIFTSIPPTELFKPTLSNSLIAGLAPMPTTTCKTVDMTNEIDLYDFHSKNFEIYYQTIVWVTMSASMTEPFSSLTAATRPSDPASKFFMGAPYKNETN